MKTFKTNFANVIFVLTMSAALIFLSLPAWAEDVPSSEAVEGVTAEQIAGTVSDEAAGETAAEADKKVEEGVEASPEAAAGGATMSMMDSGGGAGAGGAVSSAMIPEPSIFTGSLTTRIPIIVPPGRGGIAPNLALIYNSAKKNGWVGVGWDLDMGAIQRSTKYGLDCEGDEYVATSNGGSTELVSRTTDWGSGYYGAKIEGAFTKYKKNGSDETGWEVTTKDGTRYFYGTALDGSSRQECETGGFKWLLDRVEDTNGNYMEIFYEIDGQNGQIYLSRIEYTGNGTALAPSNYVQFHREERPDEILSYASHVQVKMIQRLKSIEVGINEDEVVRVYALEYKEDYEPSVLESVTQYGDDATIDQYGNITTGSSLPSTVMTYQETEDGFNSSTATPPISSHLYNVFAQGDFNGDNRTDLLYGTSDSYGRMLYDPSVLLSNGSGGFNTPVTLARPIANCKVICEGDFNKDGEADLLIAAVDSYGRVANQTGYIMTHNVNGTFLQSQLTFNYPSSGYKVISQGDYNGDGQTDFLMAKTDNYGRTITLEFIWNGYTFTYNFYPFLRFLSDGNGSFSRSVFYVENCEITYTAPQTWNPVDACIYGNARIAMATQDFNNDGKTDILFSTTDNYGRHTTLTEVFHQDIIWMGNNAGEFDIQAADFNDEFLENERVHAAGDFNGDGLPDLLIGNSDQYGRFNDSASNPNDQMKVCINHGNGSFTSTEINVGYQHFCYLGNCFDLPVNDIYLKIVSQGDFNGDGLSDFCIAQSNDDGEILNPAVYSFTYYATGDGLFRPAYSPFEISGGVFGSRVHGDFNGDGKSDFLLADIDGDTGMLDPNNFYIHYSKPVIPDLLSSISNSRGDETEIFYTPSSAYAQATNPRPPFVVQTVSSTTVSDGMGHSYLSQFSYGDALFDFEDRDFRGFAWATKTNPDGSVEKTYFKQGDYDKGRPYQMDLRASSGGSLLTKTTFTWAETAISCPGSDCKFVKLQSKKTVLDNNSTYYSQESYTYDSANGNVLTSVSTGTSIGETITSNRQYSNLAAPSGWVWRMAQERLSGSVSGTDRRRTDYEYQINSGNLLKKKLYLTGTGDPEIEYEYDSYGNLIKQWDPKDNLTEMIYDQDVYTYPVIIKYPKTGGGTIEHNIEKEYDYRFGAVSREKDENGNWTDYEYDPFGRSTTIVLPDGGQESTVYHDSVFPNYVVKSVKEVSTGPTIDQYAYMDGLGRTIMTIAFGETQSVRALSFFDNMGRVSQTVGPFFHSPSDFTYSPTYPSNAPIVETAYDKRGRPVTVETSDSTYEWNTATFSYSGFSTTITDPDGCQKTEKKDGLGRLIQVIEYTGTAKYNTYYTYNAAGDLLQVKNHNNTLTTMTYDKLGRKTAMNDPDMGTWAYQYDANGNLTSQTDAKGQTISFTSYDALNRLLTKTYSTSDPAVTYIYDNLSIANGKGQLASVSNANVTTVYNEYDVIGRARLITKTISGDSARATRYDYDLSGKLTHIGYPGTTGQPDGFQVNYAYYPGSGLLHTVTGSDMVEYANFSDYEPTGKIGAMDYGNGTSTTYDYDPKSTRLTGITTHDPSGLPANDIQRRTYAYSQAGDITGITDELAGIAYTYAYDSLHRLSWEKTNGAFTATYNYDAIGNITSKTMGSDTYTYAYHATKIHAVSQVTKNGTPNGFSYDANGNMTIGWDLSGTPVSRDITYNADNMPLSITKSSITTSFAYDSGGGRAQKTVSGLGTTYYIGEHFEKINGNEVIYIFAGDIRIARKQGADTHYFHKDHLGSSTAMTGSSGNIVETSVYWPYGYMKAHTGSYVTDYKFTDQELDSSTGLYDYGARLYDPVIGRFITPDSIIPGASNPQAFNRYNYCLNNPLVYVDPNGQFPWLIASAVIGALIAGHQSDWDPGAMALGALTSVITAGAFDIAGGICVEIHANLIQASAIHFAAGGIAGGINAAITGGNIGEGMLYSAASAGAGCYIGGKLNLGLPGTMFVGGVTSGTISVMNGGEFGQAFGYSIAHGAMMAGAGYMFNEQGDHWLYNKLRLLYKTYYISTSFEAGLGFASLDSEYHHVEKGGFSGDANANVSTSLIGAALHFNFQGLPQFNTIDLQYDLGLGRYLGVSYNPGIGTGSINVGLGLNAIPTSPLGVSKTLDQVSYIFVE